MLLSIISIALNLIYGVVLNLNLYTDRVVMPNGDIQTWRRCAISRLYLAGQPWLLYLQIACAAVSIITSILFLIGVKNSRSKFLKAVRIVSTVASTVLFIVIMIATACSPARYA